MNQAALKPWPADKVTRRSVAELVPYARNARLHSDAQVAQIAASIGEWGWTMPVLLDEAGGIIAGHGRVLAAKKLGIDAVPCMVAKGWSDAQKCAYVIADNKIADNAIWSEDLLRIEFEGLEALNFDLGLTGFLAEAVAPVPLGAPTASRVPNDRGRSRGDAEIARRVVAEEVESVRGSSARKRQVAHHPVAGLGKTGKVPVARELDHVRRREAGDLARKALRIE